MQCIANNLVMSRHVLSVRVAFLAVRMVVFDVGRSVHHVSNLAKILVRLPDIVHPRCTARVARYIKGISAKMNVRSVLQPGLYLVFRCFCLSFFSLALMRNCITCADLAPQATFFQPHQVAAVYYTNTWYSFCALMVV